MTKSDYLKHLHETAAGYQRAKEPNPKHLEAFLKALDVLKYSVNAPTTAGLRDPFSVQADLAVAQQQAKPKKDKPAAETYAAAVTGQSATQPLPIGAKRPKASAQPPVAAIGAPLGTKATAKTSVGKSPAGTSSAPKPDSADQQDASVTPDSALDFLANAPGDHTFADYQATKGALSAREAQAVQGTQTAQDTKATSDTRVAQNTQAVAQTQDAGALDVDDEDEAMMQRALWEYRQQAHQQGADPTASSSTGGPATQTRTVDDDIQYELELGRDYQREANFLEEIMSKRRLTSSEVDRFRKVSEMINVYLQRVAELCQMQVRENQAKQARDTSAMLANLKPLQPAKPKPAVQHQRQGLLLRWLHHLW